MARFVDDGTGRNNSVHEGGAGFHKGILREMGEDILSRAEGSNTGSPQGETGGKSQNTGMGGGGNIASRETFEKGSIKAAGIAPIEADVNSQTGVLNSNTPVNSKVRGR